MYNFTIYLLDNSIIYLYNLQSYFPLEPFQEIMSKFTITVNQCRSGQFYQRLFPIGRNLGSMIIKALEMGKSAFNTYNTTNELSYVASADSTLM